MGELAQLAGRPALVDAFAPGSRESAAHRTGAPPRPDYRRSELGERIMRALILRRVGLIESGAGGPVVLGTADNGDVLRLLIFSAGTVVLCVGRTFSFEF